MNDSAFETGQIEAIEPLPLGDCESCLWAGEHVPAVGHATNPHFSRYALCQNCIEEYDGRREADGTWTQ